MRITVVGLGYVGLTTAVGLARLGHDVIGVEVSPSRLDRLRRGEVPFAEPSLDSALPEVIARGNLTLAADLAELVRPVEAAVIAVGSPSLPSGGADLEPVESALAAVLVSEARPRVVMIRTSVPPGSSDAWLASSRFPGLRERYAYVPEFLSEGTALLDWTTPHRMVIGGWDPDAIEAARAVFTGIESPCLTCTPAEAEAVKYASNAFLAVRIGFTNELTGLCEAVGADIGRVLHGAGLDPRIGALFWMPGVGYGDSCLTKDMAALLHTAAGHGYVMPILEAVQATNRVQRLKPLSILRQELPGRRPVVAVLGLAYEPYCLDMREAPSRSLLPQLRMVAREITVWDPHLDARLVAELFPFVRRAVDPAAAVRGADVVIALTEYPEVVCGRWAAELRPDGEPVLVIDCKNRLPAGPFDPRTTVLRGVGRRP